MKRLTQKINYIPALVTLLAADFFTFASWYFLQLDAIPTTRLLIASIISGSVGILLFLESGHTAMVMIMEIIFREESDDESL